MAFIDDVISSGNLLEFLERLDRVLEVYGGLEGMRELWLLLSEILCSHCARYVTSITVGSCVTAL